MSKLIVSRKSWHYRLYNFTQNFMRSAGVGMVLNSIAEKRLAYDRDYKPKNLCRYFWSTVLGVITFPLFVVLTVLLLLFILICVAICYPVFKLVDWLIDRKRQSSDAPPQSNFVAEFIKARKAKVCPLIETKD